MIPHQNKGQKMNKNVKFWHSLKVKPRFLILLINLKTEQDNEGWESGGKGAQNYGRRENVVREAGRLWRPCLPPPPPTNVVPWFWFIFKYNLLHRNINSKIMAVTMDSKQEKLQENVILTFKNLKVTWRLVAMRFFYLFWQGKIHFQVLTAEKRYMFWSGLSKR